MGELSRIGSLVILRLTGNCFQENCLSSRGAFLMGGWLCTKKKPMPHGILQFRASNSRRLLRRCEEVCNDRA